MSQYLKKKEMTELLKKAQEAKLDSEASGSINTSSSSVEVEGNNIHSSFA